MTKNPKKNKSRGFQRGIQYVKDHCTAAEYSQCLKEVQEICQTTEAGGNCRTTYYNKRHGRSPLTIAETDRLNEVFARYGVTEWQDDQF